MKTSPKTSALSIAALLATGILVTPALAGDSKNFDSSFYVTQLRYDGVDAVDAADYGNGRFRATVRLSDGTEVFQFFDKDSFQQVKYGL